MIYPDAKLDGWINQYNLMILPYDCPKCRERFMTIVPIIVDGYAGLESELHLCGAQFTRLVLAPRTPSAKRLLKQIFGENEGER